VIQIALTFVLERNKNLLCQASEGKRNLHGFGRQKCVAQVLLVQGNPKTRFEVAEMTMGALAFNTVLPAKLLSLHEDDLGIETGSGRQNQCFPHGSDIARDHDLVGEFVTLPARPRPSESRWNPSSEG